MNYFIDRNGITDTQPEEKNLPKENEVALCKQFLSQIGQNKQFSGSRTSYGYKHDVEKFFDQYVSNGAFIQAAQELEFDIQREWPDSPNAIFKFRKKDLNALMKKIEIQ